MRGKMWGPGPGRTDTERLEWLVMHHADFCYSGSMEVVLDEDGKTESVTQGKTHVGCRRPCQLMYEWHVFDGATFRDAIDAAMDAEPCAGELGDCKRSNSLRDTASAHRLHEAERDRDRLDWLDSVGVECVHARDYEIAAGSLTIRAAIDLARERTQFGERDASSGERDG